MYAPRWAAYFASLDTALVRGTAPVAVDWFAREDAWAHGHQTYPTAPSGDLVALAGEVGAALGCHPGRVRTSSCAGGPVLLGRPGRSAGAANGTGAAAPAGPGAGAGRRLEPLQPRPPRAVRHLELDDERSLGQRDGLAALADLVDHVVVRGQGRVVVVPREFVDVDDEVVVAPVVDGHVGHAARVQQHLGAPVLRLLLRQARGRRQR
ncbi:alpha-N-acetylglucosaminidase C-terminal domain-containing protein [Streptomyces diastatochromogenes]|nr:alpha-N-acetylglucosaminidase C-terminal domain-containing protein [Streptomyces diastatochromogenes]